MDQPLLSFFPGESPANPDPRARRITVGDVVHMESGLDCGYAPGERELELMKRSPDFVRFALSLPMLYDPGTHASYCSPGYHLLGSVVARDGIETPTPAFSGLLSTIDRDKSPRGKLRPNQIARESAWRAVYFSSRGVPATGRSSREPAFPERLSTRRLAIERPFRNLAIYC